MDGIDAAVVRTDGERLVEPLLAGEFPHDGEMRRLLARAMRDARGMGGRDERPGALGEAERAVNEAHARVIGEMMRRAGERGLKIDLVGFHGQTVLHRPREKLTVQLGDGEWLARRCEVAVAWDMRANDVAHGGQGAPLVPVYHRALAGQVKRLPVVFVNIGGVANVTWVGAGGAMVAFDTGPGNALMDDWLRRHTGRPFDEGGRLAASGRADGRVVDGYLGHPFFAAPPPKSLDRDAFPIAPVEAMSAADGAATLALLTARAIAAAAEWFPERPELWIITGGGRRNAHLMRLLAESIGAPVIAAEEAGMDGDMMEAQAWAYLAARVARGLPITFPETTGAPRPLGGGILSRP